jgi:hypothetical protein
MGGCAGSGVKTADAVVHVGRCALQGIKATNASGSTFTVQVWDSATATTSQKVEVARMVLAANGSLEYDMHGRICAEGLYVDVTGTGTYSLEWL